MKHVLEGQKAKLIKWNICGREKILINSGKTNISSERTNKRRL